MQKGPATLAVCATAPCAASRANLTLSIEATLTLTPLYNQGLPGVLAAVRE